MWRLSLHFFMESIQRSTNAKSKSRNKRYPSASMFQSISGRVGQRMRGRMTLTRRVGLPLVKRRCCASVIALPMPEACRRTVRPLDLQKCIAMFLLSYLCTRVIQVH
jgi:hypothetical protein